MGRLEEQLGAIVEAIEYEAWRRVPDMVVALYKKAAPAACRLAVWADSAAGPEDRLWWHPDTRTAWAEVDDIEKRADWESLPDVPGVPGVALFIEPIPPPPVDGWILVKAADGYLSPIVKPHRALQTAIGGPNGLTNALVSGVIGGGLGYGAGWLADQLLPEDYFEGGHLANTLGVLGAGAGAIPGLWQWTAERRANGLGALPGIQGSGHPPPTLPPGMSEPTGYQTLPPELTGAPKYPGYKLPPHVPAPSERKPRLPITPQTPPTAPRPIPGWEDTGKTLMASVNPRFYKAAEDYGSTGAMFLQSIPVDAFNRAIWNDVRNPGNPFGAKSPWGNNEQSMGTPPYAAAATSGLLAGASQAARSDVVSPWQVGTAAALGAGKGWVTGLAAGKVLGVLAGLKPMAQQKLQEVGLWGGLITGVANSLFR
jgi:hypothetical protein